MLDWLDKELANQQSKVEESERALAEYRDKQNAMSLDDKQNIVSSRLNQLNDAVTQARRRRGSRRNRCTTRSSPIVERTRARTRFPSSPQNAQVAER